jgi:GT2 family glycosyltransferase
MSEESVPVISVCIANYDGERLLRDCIDSVLAQDCDAQVEILVHDDASSDGSLALLAARYPQARVIASADNVGFCVANNRMADAARGDYLLLLNNDAALQSGALQAFLAEARQIGGDAILTLPQHDWETAALVDRGCLLDPFHNPVPNLEPRRADVAYVIGACLWIPRGLWNELGGFPAWFGSLAEDILLCCAARLRGVPVRCVDGSGYRHRQGTSFGGNRADGGLRTTYRRRALSERNKTATLYACTPGWTMWPLLAAHLFLLAAEGAILSLVCGDARLWREVYAPALALPFGRRDQLRTQRATLQAARAATMREYFRPFAWSPRKLALLLRHGLPRIG